MSGATQLIDTTGEVLQTQIPTVQPQSLRVDAAVIELFLKLMHPVPDTQIYFNQIDHCRHGLTKALYKKLKVSALSTIIKQGDITADPKNLQHITTDNPEYYRPLDKYHYAFGVYPFQISLDPEHAQKPTSFLYREDRLSQWQCSKLSATVRLEDGTSRRMAAVHLMGLEGLLNSVVVGGYFAAVLPKRWVGREQTYLRWWQQRAALVATVSLPFSSVKCTDTEGVSHDVPGGWQLVIWQRTAHYDRTTPNSANQSRNVKWVELRHPQFVYHLDSLEESALNDCQHMFELQPWYELSVRQLNDYIETRNTNPVYGNSNYKPHTLPKVEDTWFLDPADKHQLRVRIMPRSEIAKTPYAVHIRVTNKIKLAVYENRTNPTLPLLASGLLLDLRTKLGTRKIEGTGRREWILDKDLRKRNFSEYKEDLIEHLETAGLIPCMTPDDHRRVEKQAKWLSIQLTPIERHIPIVKAASSDQLSSEDRAWELIYEDVGLNATYPELMELWRKRAKKIFLNAAGITYDFQFDDILVHAIKQGLLNGNVMGLGKTRETLFGFLLRNGNHLFIICPAKLIGIWQDEIRDTIAPWMERVKRSWGGRTTPALKAEWQQRVQQWKAEQKAAGLQVHPIPKGLCQGGSSIFHCSVNIVESADDLRRENLKTFNVISYDKLKSIPRDSQFYKCPQCGVVVCKKFRSDYIPTCPGNPAMPADKQCCNVVKVWKKNNKKRGLRKYKVVCNEAGQPVKKIHWNNPAGFPQEIIKVIDDRPPRPVVPRMVEQQNIHKKMRCILDGHIIDKKTEERIPKYRWEERKVHNKAIHVKWTFADIVRRLANHAAADEGQYAANDDSQRTIALLHTRRIRSKYLLTGTPVKGYPKKIIPLLNWCFSRAIFPDYQLYEPDGTLNFLKKYQTEVMVVRKKRWLEDEEGEKDEDEKLAELAQASRRQKHKPTEETREKKIVPKISNPELFQAELAPVMVRHVRTEPRVAANIPPKTVKPEDHIVDMDKEHREYYQKWLDVFAEWWRIKKEEEEGEKAGDGPLLAKLVYLKNAATNPHHMLDGISEKKKDETAKQWAQKIGKYKSPKPTEKFIALTKLLVEARKHGDKSIVFMDRHANLDLGEKFSTAANIGYVRVDGGVSLKIKDGESRSLRHQMVDWFRCQNDKWWMWAGLESMAEGMNIPEANHGFCYDYPWDPTPLRQAIGRMIRPAQSKTIYAHYMAHRGTIEEYMAALCYLKGRSGDEGIDYMSFGDFTGKLVPDIQQYAQAIVDGTQDIMAAEMWTAVDLLKKSHTDDDEGDRYVA